MYCHSPCGVSEWRAVSNACAHVVPSRGAGGWGKEETSDVCVSHHLFPKVQHALWHSLSHQDKSKWVAASSRILTLHRHDPASLFRLPNTSSHILDQVRTTTVGRGAVLEQCRACTKRGGGSGERVLTGCKPHYRPAQRPDAVRRHAFDGALRGQAGWAASPSPCRAGTPTPARRQAVSQRPPAGDSEWGGRRAKGAGAPPVSRSRRTGPSGCRGPARETGTWISNASRR